MTETKKRPTLHVARTEPSRCRLGDYTQEQRKRLTVAELIIVMGPAHVNHQDFKPKSRSLLPMPNLTGVHGHVIEEYHVSLWALMKRALRWVLA